MRPLTDREWQTLMDLADPSLCLISDGETLERLVADGFVHRLTNCYRPSPLGTAALRQHATPRPDGARLEPSPAATLFEKQIERKDSE
jgi:hypothetical protein